MVQVATPSRERVEHYQTLRVKVEREVGRINGEFGRVGVPAVHYLHQSYSRSELAALYCAADVMMVTPLRDGMNLVAKEYVACARRPRAARSCSASSPAPPAELRQAFLCNPHDLDGVKDALMRAVTSRTSEAKRRMRMHACAATCARTTSASGRGRSSTALASPRDGRNRDRAQRRSAASSVRPHRRRLRAQRGDGVTHGSIDAQLRAAVGRIARVPQLLVACDYDGTLAPIVDDPTQAAPAAGGGRGRSGRSPRCRRRPSRSISGRALRDLAALSRLPSEVHLVGSHGSEFDVGFVERTRAGAGRAAHPAAGGAATRSPRASPGVRLESKPASVAVHTARAPTGTVAERVVDGGRAAARRRGRTCT